MEKQLGFAHNLGRAESLRLSPVLTRLMESQMWHQLAGSVALWGEVFRKWTMASARLDARYFSFSLYATGIFQAATPVLELRGSKM